MANVNDVAAYIVSKFDSPISTMKLQKLSYMAQGWMLAVLGHELFSDDFRAWKNGPVCYSLYENHRGMYSVRDWANGDASRLEPAERIILDGVIKNYGALSGLQLSELTHRPGTPWSRTRAAVGAVEGVRANATIDKNEIQTHFKQLLGLQG